MNSEKSNTVILYYTFGGATKKEAERLSAELGAPLYQVKEVRKRGIFSAFVSGCHKAMHRDASAIQPVDVDLEKYDRILIGCPIWAGSPAPAFNAIVKLLPKGKEVALFLCSGGGETPKSAQGTKDLIEKQGCTVVSYRDVRTSTPPKKPVT